MTRNAKRRRPKRKRSLGQIERRIHNQCVEAWQHEIRNKWRAKYGLSPLPPRQFQGRKKKPPPQIIVVTKPERLDPPPYRQGMRGEDFYRTREWREARYQALRTHGTSCQCCGAQGKVHVDHIKPRSLFPDLELNPSNLQVLCEDCNIGKSNKDSTDWRTKGTIT